MPLTPNGKVDRLHLPAPAHYASASTKGSEPHTRMEVVLAEIWKEVLKITKRQHLRMIFFNLVATHCSPHR